jgi:Flp pilus assembly protein TadD
MRCCALTVCACEGTGARHGGRRNGARLRRGWVFAAGAAALAICVAAVHWPALSARALSFDDNQYLVDNELVRNPSWESVGRFFVEVIEPSSVKGYYQPLAMTSLMLDCALGARPDHLTPLRRTSLVLHVVNAVLMAALLRLLLGSTPAAIAGGLLFALHPVTMETTVWIAERKGLLASMFSLATLVLYVAWRRTGSRTALMVSLASFALALLSKPTGIALPVVLVLLDLWPLNRFGAKSLLEKVPFFLLSAACAIVTYLGQHRIESAIVAGETVSRAPLSIAWATAFYLQKLAWPAGMSGFYNAPEPMALTNPAVVQGVAGFVLVATAILVSLRWTRAPGVGAAMFLLMIAPTFGIVTFTTVAAADKYAYFPMVGLLVPVAAALAWAFGSSSRGRFRSRAATWLVGAVVTAACIGEASSTRRTIRVWKDTETLMRYMSENFPRPWQPLNGLGTELLAQGRTDEAVACYERSVQIRSDYFRSQANLAKALATAGQFDEALQHYETALRLAPLNPEIHFGLANLLVQTGEQRAAEGAFAEALRLRPHYPSAHYNLGLLLVGLGRFSEAQAHFEQAVRQEPRHSYARCSLAQTLIRQGRIEDGLAQFEEALRQAPGDALVRMSFGETLEKLGRREQALVHFREAVRLRPGEAAFRATLEEALTAPP